MENENEIKESILSEVEMENKTSSESAELVSDKNINNEQVREVENTTKEYFDIYSDTMTEMRDLVAMNSMKETLQSTLDSLNIKEENIKEAYNTFKLFNKEVETLNKNQIENLFNILGYSIDDVKDKDENEIFEFKKNLVELVISTEEGMRSFDEMSKETDNITETFKAEMDKILASLNMTEQLENLTKAINEEKDENKKKELYLIYTGIYSSLSLDNIIRAIDNKGYNQLLKESKKKYDKVGNSLYIDIFTNSLSMKWLYYQKIFFKSLIIKDYDAVCILGSANNDNKELIDFINKNNIKIIRRNKL